MPHREHRQPQDVSETVTNYLDMTKPRTRKQSDRPSQPTERRRVGRRKRPPKAIDNEGLPLETGNDLA